MGKNQNTGKVKPGDTCSLCDRPLNYLKPIPICRMHYQRWWQYGSFDRVRRVLKPYQIKAGYLKVWDPKRKKSVLHHRLIMENYLGRELLPTEHIHHKDGDKQNNHIENLELTTRVKHNYLHSGNQFVQDWKEYADKIAAPRIGRGKKNWQNEVCLVYGCHTKAKVRALCLLHYQVYSRWEKAPLEDSV